MILFLYGMNGAQAQEAEDEVTSEQSVDAYNSLEDAQPGPPGVFEQRLYLTWGYVPAEGNTPSETLEFSYTGKGHLQNSEFLLAQYFEHDDVDNTTAFVGGWNQRWLRDAGRGHWLPSVGTLTEYWLRTPFLIQGDAFAPGATNGDHIGETLTIAKYLGPGSLYLNGEVERRLFNSAICVTDQDVAIQPEDAPDQNGILAPNYDGCDYWAPWTLAARVGYQWNAIPDKLNIVVDYIHETNEFKTQTASETLPEPETHFPYDMGEVAVSWHVNSHWTISPGVQFGLDGHEETPAYEAGLFLLHE